MILYQALLKDIDIDDCTGATQIRTGIGVYVVKQCGTFVSTLVEIHSELGRLDFTAHGDGPGFVDQFARVVTSDFNSLGITVDTLVDDHQIAFRRAVGKIRGGIHADVNHAFLNLLVQVLDDLVGISLVPSALHSAGIIDDTGARSIIGFCGLVALAATETAEYDGNDNQDTEDDAHGFLELGIIVLAAALVGVFGLIPFELLLPLSA